MSKFSKKLQVSYFNFKTKITKEYFSARVFNVS